MNTEMVWNEFSDGLRRFVRARVDSDADADDVVQDVFVKILDRQSQLRERDRLAGWIFRIASNAVVDHHRASRLPLLPPPQPAALADDSVEEELAACVRPFISMLDEPYRSALTWTEIEGMTQRAAAERAQISLSGMKSRVQRGRAQLRGLFETCCVIQLDTRNHVTDYEPRRSGDCSCD